MQARAALLDRLRRSGLGAWLAMAYALCVMALALAPAPAMAAFGGSDGVVLCSGAPVPDDGQPVPALTIRPLGIVFPGRLKKILPVRDHSYAALAGGRLAAIRSSSN